MRTNSDITVWHFDDSEEVYYTKVFCGVFADEVRIADKNGIKQKGFYDAKILRVRIPTKEDISVFLGDYIRVGKYDEESPEKMLCFKVNEIKDNRRGGQPHWRISCGG